MLQELTRTRKNPHLGMAGLQILALGASSGGSFVVSDLPGALSRVGLKLVGLISQIAAQHDPSDDWPKLPTVYMTMDRDSRTEASAAAAVRALGAAGVAARHVRLPPAALQPGFFADRIAGVDRAASAKMVAALAAAGMLSPNGALAADPRHTDWRSTLRGLAAGDSLKADRSAVSEVMIGLGQMVALYYRSPTLYQIH